MRVCDWVKSLILSTSLNPALIWTPLKRLGICFSWILKGPGPFCENHVRELEGWDVCWVGGDGELGSAHDECLLALFSNCRQENVEP